MRYELPCMKARRFYQKIVPRGAAWVNAEKLARPVTSGTGSNDYPPAQQTAEAGPTLKERGAPDTPSGGSVTNLSSYVRATGYADEGVRPSIPSQTRQ